MRQRMRWDCLHIHPFLNLKFKIIQIVPGLVGFRASYGDTLLFLSFGNMNVYNDMSDNLNYDENVPL